MPQNAGSTRYRLHCSGWLLSQSVWVSLRNHSQQLQNNFTPVRLVLLWAGLNWVRPQMVPLANALGHPPPLKASHWHELPTPLVPLCCPPSQYTQGRWPPSLSPLGRSSLHLSLPQGQKEQKSQRQPVPSTSASGSPRQGTLCCSKKIH